MHCCAESIFEQRGAGFGAAWALQRSSVIGRHRLNVNQATDFAAARPALRPENRQPPRNVPSSER